MARFTSSNETFQWGSGVQVRRDGMEELTYRFRELTVGRGEVWRGDPHVIRKVHNYPHRGETMIMLEGGFDVTLDRRSAAMFPGPGRVVTVEFHP